MSSAGLSTTVLPAASAGANPHPAIGMGKFHGTMIPTTPSGSRNVTSMPPATGIWRPNSRSGAAGVVVQHVADVAGLPAGVADGVAGAAHLQLRQLVDVGVDDGGEAAQQPGPVRGRDRTPGRPRGDGPGDGRVHLRDVERLDLGDDLLGRGVEDLVQCRRRPLRTARTPAVRSQSVTAASKASSSTSAARR